MSRHAPFPYSAADLDRFRQVQRLAYDMALGVEAQLQIGMTETEVCTLLEVAQRGSRVDQVFHEPFAWFGRRTELGPDWVAASGMAQPADTASRKGTGAATQSGFFPTDTALSYGMPLIIDLAPTLEGFSADIGYSCTVGANPVFEELDRGLARIRTFLLDGVRAGRTLHDLYRALDELVAEHDALSCHRHYPEGALGHLLFPLEVDPPRPTPLRGFGPAAAEGLVAASLGALEHGEGYPVWNDRALADRPPTPGLWAVEPHIGRDGVGVKFEELLVVTEDDAYWLDDHLPHCQRWAAAGYSTELYRAAMTPNRTRARLAAHKRRATTELAILGATAAMLEERTFRDISVEEVMSSAGLSRTAFYRYFPDLESVVTRLMSRLVSELRDASHQWLFSENPEAQLHDSLSHFATVYHAHGRLMRAFDDASAAGPELKQQWGVTLDELVGPVERHIVALAELGRVDVTHPVETVRALAVLTDRYLLDVYWSDDRVPIERPTSVLEQIWVRTLRLH